MHYAVLVVTVLLTLYNWWLVRGVRRDLQRVNPERLTRLVDELVATAEEAAAVVSERTQRLQSVLDQADVKAADLGSLVGKAAFGALPHPEAPTRSGPGQTVRSGPAPERMGVATPAHPPPFDRPLSPEPARAGETTVRNWEPAELAAPEAVAATAEPGRDEVYALADSGMDPRGIARRLGITLGEVEMILGLRKFN